ncbi:MULTISPECIES: dephospho-CoA kinase [Proteus]|uniref:Dephospho-CoA kinase n=1 Tax=Proteus penneri TaxID=102862 RepID=A0A0G4Q5V1_9GAMM|nr:MULTISPECIES: dephospho-CoA kinase [Proteus]MBJ2117193.1 dephospho-CoA kinase [Proteus penneri]NBM49732.1 dephospho-CoA kinase [Proteus sp. G2666]CRL61004.1 Dephospho-CoA kinase [Proteus penneri]SUC02307.1 dephospho-CoA kinase [Proteus penneri]
MAYTVALTGGIGSGKTTVANAFASLGVPLVDADIIARLVVEPHSLGLNALHQHFGDCILLPDGSLNRALLRQIIFENNEEKDWVNNLLHPLIQQETQKQIQQINAPYLIWVVPLLIENKLTHLASRVLVVDVTQEEQIERTMKRDGVSREQVLNILKAQAQRQERLAVADDIIENHDNSQHMIEKVKQLHQHYLELAQQALQDNCHE